MVKQTKLMTKEQLITVLKNIIETINLDDSFEGRISYTCLDGEEHDEIPSNQFEVNAFYRIGNSMGQGGSISTISIEEDQG